MSGLDRDRVAAALPAYEVGGELGRGGWGVVLEGRHRQLGREVAIKELPRAFGSDPAVRARFVAEARVLAALDHPHVVAVYDFVEEEGLCLLIMEKLTGGTLWDRFTTTGLTSDVAVATTLATCAALDFAHSRSVLHRDIKPENLMFSATGALKVTDFGIAKVLGGPATLATRAGEVLGTPAYMAPEQAQARELTTATDVYATGVMAYELLSGRLPFEDDGDALALLYRHVYEQPIALGKVAPTIPASVGDVVMAALATDPEERHATAEAFAVALAEAATSAWGPGWLHRSDVAVMGATSIVAITERDLRPQLSPMVAADRGKPAPPTEPERGVAEPGAGAPPSPPPGQPGPPSPPPTSSRPLRPSTSSHTRPAPALGLGQADVAPLHEVVERPPAPTPHILVTMAFLLLSIAFAFIGLGSPSREGDLPLAVNGVDVDSGQPVELDLADPVTVSGRSPGAPVGQLRLRLSALGVPLGWGEGEARQEPDGTFAGAVEARAARFLAAGEVTATIELLTAEGQPVTGEAAPSRRAFGVRSEQSPFLTVPGIAGTAFLLFVVAYAESILRALRRGRKQVIGTATMLVVGAAWGVVCVLVAWLLSETEPATPTVVVCTLVGAGAGLAAALAARRSSQRRRFRVRR